MTEHMAEIYSNFIEANESNKHSSGIRKSFETFDNTGSHCYLNEIYEKNYVLVDKVYFTPNLMYIPGRFVIAYKDVEMINKLSGINEYEIIMVDGQKHRLCMLKITQAELSKHVNGEAAQQLNRKITFKDMVLYLLILGLLYGIYYSIFYGIPALIEWLIGLF